MPPKRTAHSTPFRLSEPALSLQISQRPEIDKIFELAGFRFGLLRAQFLDHRLERCASGERAAFENPGAAHSGKLDGFRIVSPQCRFDSCFAATESLYHAVERRMQGEGTIKPNRTQVDIRMGGRIRFAV
jgi:hypothetical protein